MNKNDYVYFILRIRYYILYYIYIYIFTHICRNIWDMFSYMFSYIVQIVLYGSLISLVYFYILFICLQFLYGYFIFHVRSAYVSNDVLFVIISFLDTAYIFIFNSYMNPIRICTHIFICYSSVYT